MGAGELRIGLDDRQKLGLEPVRGSLRRVDSDLLVFDVRTVRQVLDARVSGPVVGLRLLGAFGIFALILSAIGVYSVVSFSVSERTREIGVRMALGAPAGSIYKQVIRQGMVAALAGLVVGLAGGYGFGVIFSALSPLADAIDAMALVPVAATMITVVLLACYIPARRAARVDPVVALRRE